VCCPAAFDAESKRREVVQRFNAVPWEHLADDAVNGMPTRPLSRPRDQSASKASWGRSSSSGARHSPAEDQDHPSLDVAQRSPASRRDGRRAPWQTWLRAEDRAAWARIERIGGASGVDRSRMSGLELLQMSGPQRRLLVIVALCAVSFVGPATARRSEGPNLVSNAGAEAGPAAQDDHSVVVPAGWTTIGSFTVVRYGVSGFPSAGDVPAGGTNLFAGGPGSPLSTGSQTVNVSSSTAAIDAGTVDAVLDGWLGGWEGQEDAATVSATFLDKDAKSLGAVTIGPVTASQRADKTTFLYRTAHERVPVGTRSIRVTITARRASGVYNDGYADDFSLALGKAAPKAGPGGAKVTFWFRASGPAKERPPVADYVRSQMRGSGSVTLARAVSRGHGAVKVTRGRGTISVVHQFALHSERLWLSIHGGGTYSSTTSGQDSLSRLVVGVTGSNVASCPKGRAGFLGLEDYKPDSTDAVELQLCGRSYSLGIERGKARVNIIPR